MKVIAIVVFAGIWASTSAQSYTLTAPAPQAPAPSYQPSFQPSYQPYQPPVYQAKPAYGPVNIGMPVPYTYPSAAPPGENPLEYL
jgi:hypothetical protein